MDFQWSEDEIQHRQEIREFLADVLPPDWEDLAKDGPGGDAQAAFSRDF